MTAFLRSRGLKRSPNPNKIRPFRCTTHAATTQAARVWRTVSWISRWLPMILRALCVALFGVHPRGPKDHSEKIVKLRYNLYGDGFARTDNSGRLRLAGPLDVTIYSRPGCHLCEQAKTQIAPLLKEFGARLTEMNIDEDAQLHALRLRCAGDFSGCAEGRQASRRSRSISPPASRQFPLNHAPAADIRAESTKGVAGQAPKGPPRTVNGVSRSANPMAILAPGTKSRLLKE